MLPLLHPLSKTSIELRRAINRLSIFKDQNPHDEDINHVENLITDLKEARSHIPDKFRDEDIVNPPTI